MIISFHKFEALSRNLCNSQIGPFPVLHSVYGFPYLSGGSQLITIG